MQELKNKYEPEKYLFTLNKKDKTFSISNLRVLKDNHEIKIKDNGKWCVELIGYIKEKEKTRVPVKFKLISDREIVSNIKQISAPIRKMNLCKDVKNIFSEEENISKFKIINMTTQFNFISLDRIKLLFVGGSFAPENY